MKKDKFLREEKLKRTAHGPLGRPERPNVLTACNMSVAARLGPTTRSEHAALLLAGELV